MTSEEESAVAYQSTGAELVALLGEVQWKAQRDYIKSDRGQELMRLIIDQLLDDARMGARESWFTTDLPREGAFTQRHYVLCVRYLGLKFSLPSPLDVTIYHELADQL